jgi:predicted MPP superfamily phosphohydrolase
LDGDEASPVPPPNPMAALGRLVVRRILPLLALLVLLVASWGYWVETWMPVVRRATVTLDQPAMRGQRLTLALASDIHVGSHGMSAARLDRVVALINAQRPDAIVLAGDFVNGEKPDDPAFHPEMLGGPLSRLRAPLGVYAVMGNHDSATDPVAVTRVLERAGITVLNDEAVRLGPIALLGFDDYTRRHLRMDQILGRARVLGGPIVAVEHAPNLGHTLPPDVPVLLAGHTHCGQIDIPGLSTANSPIDGRKLYDPAFRCGLIATGRHHVFVTAGVGSGSFPLRIGTRTDFWMITLTGR